MILLAQGKKQAEIAKALEHHFSRAETTRSRKLQCNERTKQLFEASSK